MSLSPPDVNLDWEAAFPELGDTTPAENVASIRGDVDANDARASLSAIKRPGRWFYIPLQHGSKKPVDGERWKELSTNDPNVIEGWIAEGLNLGLYCGRSGLLTVDLDTDKATGAKVGEATWAQLQTERGDAPDTYEVETCNGGRHLYFKGSGPTSANRLGPKVDTRGGIDGGSAGYVVAAGSIVDGKPYTVIAHRKPAELPGWVSDALAARATATAADPNIELDLAVNVARAVRYLQARVEAVQGQGADHLTFEAACELRDYGVSEDKALELMADHYKISPRDERLEAFLERKVANAYAYGQNEPGAWGVGDLAATYSAVLDQLPPEEREGAVRPQQGARFALRSEAMQDARPPITWLVEGLLQDTCTAVIHAPWNSYKSFWAIDVALAVASGVPAFGHFKVNRQGPVIYLAGEGLAGIETMRRPAWRAARKIAPDKALPFYTIDNVPRVANEADVTACMDAIKAAVSGELQGRRPVLIVIDTMSRAMPGLNENEAGDATKYLNAAEAIRQAFGCTVLTVAHEGKDGEKGLRGSSAFSGGFDIILRMDAHLDGLSASVSSPKIKDGSPIEPFGLVGCEVQLGGDKHSLVFDWADPSDFRGAKARKLTRLALGAALAELKAEKGQTVTTDQLAMFLAGEFAADEKVVSGWKRDLQRRAKADFRAYVHTLGKGGRGSATLWTLGDPPAEEITV